MAETILMSQSNDGGRLNTGGQRPIRWELQPQPSALAGPDHQPPKPERVEGVRQAANGRGMNRLSAIGTGPPFRVVSAQPPQSYRAGPNGTDSPNRQRQTKRERKTMMIFSILTTLLILAAATVSAVGRDSKTGLMVGNHPIPGTNTLTKRLRYLFLRTDDKSAGSLGGWPTQGGPDPTRGIVPFGSNRLDRDNPLNKGGFAVGGNKKSYNGFTVSQVNGHMLSVGNEFFRMGALNVLVHVLASITVGPHPDRINAKDTPKRSLNDCLGDYFPGLPVPKKARKHNPITTNNNVVEAVARLIDACIMQMNCLWDLTSKYQPSAAKHAVLQVLYETREMVRMPWTCAEFSAWWVDEFKIGLDEVLAIAQGDLQLTYNNDEGKWEAVQKAMRKKVKQQVIDLSTAGGVIDEIRKLAIRATPGEVIDEDGTEVVGEITPESIRQAVRDVYAMLNTDEPGDLWVPSKATDVESAVEKVTTAAVHMILD